MTAKASAAIYAFTRRPQLNLSLRDQLTLLRRLARDAISAKFEYENYFRRELRRAMLTVPSDTKRIAILRFQEEALRDSQRRTAEHMCDMLRGLDEAITSAMDFDHICDLLGVNASHRSAAREHFSVERGAVATVAFIAGLEDSASARSGRKVAESRSGPLFQIYMAGFYRTVREKPGFFDGIAGEVLIPPSSREPDFEPPTKH
ncbi:hypothetical protein [Pseudomonas huanghezhanensis]|uniref:hypothetical protein n=1 Tax=Pseudomonas huanghezhanensis TaxID=3002903 RepID=UPI002285E894|nr:hypothetical protein [Pseudomonas sp. BSw22131]